jgi:hypothetical protein
MITGTPRDREKAAARSEANAGDIPVWRIQGRNVVYRERTKIVVLSNDRGRVSG